jgi:hypothetical protein
MRADLVGVGGLGGGLDRSGPLPALRHLHRRVSGPGD